MKKSLVATGIVIALGVIWTGASWYTGKQFAQQLDGLTDTLNTQLKETYPDAGLKIVYRDYQDGIFTSTFSYVLQADGSAKGATFLTPDEEIVLNQTISHGPFPLTQLKTFNLIPALASVHTEFANTPAMKEVFELTKNKSFLTAETRMAYSGDTQSVVTFIPVDFQKDDQTFTFSGAEFQLAVGQDLRSSKLSGTIGHLMSEKKGPWKRTEKFEMSDFTLSGNNAKGKFDLDLGDANVTVKSMTFSSDRSDPVTLNNVSMQTSVTEDDKNLASKLSLGLESLTVAGRNLGSGAVNITIAQLDGEGTKQFATAYQQNVNKLLQQTRDLNPSIYQYEMTNTILQHLPQLLKGNPAITISPISWKNSKGESTFTLSLDLTDPQQNSASVADSRLADKEKIILQAVKKLDVKLNIPLAMLTELMVQSESKQSTTEEEKQKANNEAMQRAKMFASIGQMNHLSVTKDNAITSSLQYADGQVDFNGQKMSLDEFISPFISLPAEEEGEESQPSGHEHPVSPIPAP